MRQARWQRLILPIVQFWNGHCLQVAILVFRPIFTGILLISICRGRASIDSQIQRFFMELLALVVRMH